MTSDGQGARVLLPRWRAYRECALQRWESHVTGADRHWAGSRSSRRSSPSRFPSRKAHSLECVGAETPGTLSNDRKPLCLRSLCPPDQAAFDRMSSQSEHLKAPTISGEPKVAGCSRSSRTPASFASSDVSVPVAATSRPLPRSCARDVHPAQGTPSGTPLDTSRTEAGRISDKRGTRAGQNPSRGNSGRVI